MTELAAGGGTEGNEAAAAELTRQRAITERLLLAALEARDVSSEAATAGRRATFLASASRDLALSFDEEGAREAIRRRTLWRLAAIVVIMNKIVSKRH